MLTWIEELALTIVIGVLSKLIKSPTTSVPISVLQHIRDDASVVVLALNPQAPPPPGYVKAT